MFEVPLFYSRALVDKRYLKALDKELHIMNALISRDHDLALRSCKGVGRSEA
jgi:hypothetical protein